MSAPEPIAAVTADGRGRALADGNVLPLLGLGVWQVPDGPECVDAVRAALELGYRHIDTVQAYRNEESVGQALRESGVAREDVFVTTKFHPSRKDRSPRPSSACGGWGSTTSTSTSSTGRRVARPGRGPAWSKHVRRGMRDRSACPTSAPMSCAGCLQSRQSL